MYWRPSGRVTGVLPAPALKSSAPATGLGEPAVTTACPFGAGGA